MPRAKRQTSLLGLVESDSDEISEVVVAIPRTTKAKASGRHSAMAPRKATRGSRATSNKVTKPVPSSTRRPSERAAAVAAVTESPQNAVKPSGPGRGRRAKATATIEVPDSQPPLHDSPPQKKTKGAPRGRPKTVKEPEPEPDVEDSFADTSLEPKKPARGKRGRPAKRPDPVPEEEEPNSEPNSEPQAQNDAMDVDMSDDSPQMEELLPHPKNQKLSVPRHTPATYFGSVLRRPSVAVEHGTATVDPTLRRRLGHLTQKYDALELKYRDLREIGVKEAERQFDKLQKQSDERSNTAKQLIASLKAELATQTALAKEGVRTKNQLDETDCKVEELQAHVGELTASLSEARAQISMLNTKLSASRTVEPITNTRYPGSALKNSASAVKQAANNDAAQLGQMKVELYCDLTGLIVTSMRRDGDDDVFDCIQTGRNGTLHFRLSVHDDNSVSFDDAPFIYQPQLDPNRDTEMIEMLPDYLSDEIKFPRKQASKFYARVMKALTE